MDTVELLRPKGASRLIGFPGGVEYKFFGSVPVPVPRVVADRCLTYNTPGQRPTFAVTRNEYDPDTDVDAAFGVEWKAWRLRS
jgi:hypothetical protein